MPTINDCQLLSGLTQHYKENLSEVPLSVRNKTKRKRKQKIEVIPATLLKAPKAANYEALRTHETEVLQKTTLPSDTGSIPNSHVPLPGHERQEMNKRISLSDAVSPPAPVSNALVTSLYLPIKENKLTKTNLDDSFSYSQ